MTAPTPHTDPAPDQNPGGTDAVVDDPDDYPLVTPELPVPDPDA